MRNLRKHRPLYLSIVAMAVFILVYFYLRRFNPSDASEVIVTVLAIVAGVSFWLEYHRNSQINEAQFIVELNNQFLNDEKMTRVEHHLEQFYHLVKGGKSAEAEAFAEELEAIYDIGKDERQDLVNYLVHLEGVATLVEDNVLRLKSITDLMAYRYFIAVNNPVVQKLELLEYKEFYKGIFAIYESWAKVVGAEMPLAEYRLCP